MDVAIADNYFARLSNLPNVALDRSAAAKLRYSARSIRQPQTSARRGG